MKMFAKYHNEGHIIPVEVIDNNHNTALIRALEGEPFEYRGSKFPYLLGHTEMFSVPLHTLNEIRIYNQPGDWEDLSIQPSESDIQRIGDWLEDYTAAVVEEVFDNRIGG